MVGSRRNVLAAGLESLQLGLERLLLAGLWLFSQGLRLVGLGLLGV